MTTNWNVKSTTPSQEKKSFYSLGRKKQVRKEWLALLSRGNNYRLRTPQIQLKTINSSIIVNFQAFLRHYYSLQNTVRTPIQNNSLNSFFHGN